MRLAAGALAIAALLPAVTAGAGVTRARYLMGTICEITADSAAQIEIAFEEAKRVEGMLSTWRDDTELARVNHGDAAAASPELTSLLETAMRWQRDTNGAFDPRIRGLIDVWQTRGAGAVPSSDQIANAMREHRYEEGAFGKGYAIDRMLARIDGDTTVNFGGQIGRRGTIRVAIADPRHRDQPVMAFDLTDGSLSTSSGSEKAFTVAGRPFSHLIDPRNGQALPPRGSVSVIHRSALIADILSTALYVMGPADGPRWARTHSITAVFIDDGNNIELSAPLAGLEVLDPRFKVRRRN